MPATSKPEPSRRARKRGSSRPGRDDPLTAAARPSRAIVPASPAAEEPRRRAQQGGHHLQIMCDDATWRTFRAHCVAAGVTMGVRVAQLVAGDVGAELSDRSSAIAGQLELEASDPPAGSTTVHRKRPRPAAAKERSLPVVSEKELAKEAAAGARAGVKANKRSPGKKEGRPTRRRSS